MTYLTMPAIVNKQNRIAMRELGGKTSSDPLDVDGILRPEGSLVFQGFSGRRDRSLPNQHIYRGVLRWSLAVKGEAYESVSFAGMLSDLESSQPLAKATEEIGDGGENDGSIG